jgi:hypothetical protein
MGQGLMLSGRGLEYSGQGVVLNSLPGFRVERPGSSV